MNLSRGESLKRLGTVQELKRLTGGERPASRLDMVRILLVGGDDVIRCKLNETRLKIVVNASV